mmetsp:Transcript_19561/g.31474  ORF Transcript_19561/g.31474 Transcript_19561/m.31474 type:complete len:203 (-) Transcript_19561:71-679(-)
MRRRCRRRRRRRGEGEGALAPRPLPRAVHVGGTVPVAFGGCQPHGLAHDATAVRGATQRAVLRAAGCARGGWRLSFLARAVHVGGAVPVALSGGELHGRALDATTLRGAIQRHVRAWATGFADRGRRLSFLARARVAVPGRGCLAPLEAGRWWGRPCAARTPRRLPLQGVICGGQLAPALGPLELSRHGPGRIGQARRPLPR